MKGVEATAEEQERLATGNNNGSLDCKLPPHRRSSPFYSTRVFMLVFLSGWVLQGMFLTYFVSVTTTLEKLYKVESTTTGTLLSATEIGQICTALFLTYLAGRGHRPRWIASMMLVLALGVLGCVLPHLLYGARLLDVHLDAHRPGAAPVCAAANASAHCDAARDEARGSIAAVVIPWLFVSLLVVGVGQTGIATLGIPYVDDNIASKKSPLYMAITIGIRVIGPALGFMLGALCTRIYVEPLQDPGYTSADPRWVGAWWIGMVLISGCVVLLSALMFLFPRQIRAQPPPKRVKDKSEPLFKDFIATIKRQLTNDILMWRTGSSVLHLMPISGVYSFLPKYLENQFQLPAHLAALLSGLSGILVMGVGIIASGVVILRLVPTARQVAAWTACTALIYSAGMVVLMFVSCSEESYRLLPTAERNATLACSAACQCDAVPYSPVCGQDSFTYLSPCQAGCAGALHLNATSYLYYNCSCVDAAARGGKVHDVLSLYNLNETSLSVRNLGLEYADDVLGADVLSAHVLSTDVLSAGVLSTGGLAVSGECSSGPCDQIYVFIAIFAAIMFIHATGEVGSVLLIIRCTDKMDKAMAMGVIQFAIGVFGNVPCPIVFGAAIDAACRLRDAACALTGACAAYDSHQFRHFFLGLSAALMFLAFIMDLLVWRAAGRIDMNPESDPPPPALAAPPAPPAAPAPPGGDTQL